VRGFWRLGAKVALEHGINANIVHTWRKLARQQCAEPVAAPTFMPLALEAAAPALPSQCIDIELHRGAVSMTLSWPLSGAVELTNFARGLFR